MGGVALRWWCVMGVVVRRKPAAGDKIENSKHVFRGLPGLVGSSRWRFWTQLTAVFLLVRFGGDSVGSRTKPTKGAGWLRDQYTATRE